jgi:hypothetical protein
MRVDNYFSANESSFLGGKMAINFVNALFLIF